MDFFELEIVFIPWQKNNAKYNKKSLIGDILSLYRVNLFFLMGTKILAITAWYDRWCNQIRWNLFCLSHTIDFVESIITPFLTETEREMNKQYITRYLIRLRELYDVSCDFRASRSLWAGVAVRLSSRRDEMVGRGIGRKRNSQRKRSKLPLIFRAWATKRNVYRGKALLDDVRASLLQMFNFQR